MKRRAVHRTEMEKHRNTARLVQHYWLIAAKEALQGDMGKLRRHVAMAEGKTHDEMIDEMRASLAHLLGERKGG